MKEVDEVNQLIFEYLEKSMLGLPPQIQVLRDRYFCAIPTMIQHIILRQFRRNYQTDYNILKTAPMERHDLILQTWLGYKIIPGYEPAIVIFPVDAMERGAESVHRIPLEGYIKHETHQP